MSGPKHAGVCAYENIIVIIKKCVHFVGLHCYSCIIMHGMENVKFVNAQQAQQVYHFKNIKERLCKSNYCFIKLCTP